MRIVDQVRQLAEDIITAEGLELVHVEFVSEGRKWILRIYIDRETGVTIDDCVRISRQLGYELDVADMISGEYALEVSSPGVDRIVGSRRDFARFAGERVKMKLKHPVGGRKNLTGTLEGMDEAHDTVRVNVDGEETAVPFDNIRRANLQRDVEPPKNKK